MSLSLSFGVRQNRCSELDYPVMTMHSCSTYRNMTDRKVNCQGVTLFARIENYLIQHRQHPALIALGEAIRHARRQQGISQEKLALMAEIDRSYIGRVERGDNNVAVLTLLKIAQAIDVSLMDLMKAAKL